MLISLAKNTIRNFCNKSVSFKQTVRDIVLLFHDIAGLDMTFKEWKQLCCKVWGNEYQNSQLDRFDKLGEGKNTIRKFRKNYLCRLHP